MKELEDGLTFNNDTPVNNRSSLKRSKDEIIDDNSFIYRDMAQSLLNKKAKKKDLVSKVGYLKKDFVITSKKAIKKEIIQQLYSWGFSIFKPVEKIDAFGR